jgi:hypothetical protein
MTVSGMMSPPQRNANANGHNDLISGQASSTLSETQGL